QHGGSVQVEQLERPAHERAYVPSVFEPTPHQLVGAWHLDPKTVSTLAIARGGPVRHDRGAVRWVFHDGVLRPRPGVPGDHQLAVEQSHLDIARDEPKDP